VGTGKKYGYDYVAMLLGNSHGEEGYEFNVVGSGELRIESRHAVSDKFSDWQEIDMTKQ
jgi:hypothetical protein